MADHDYCCSIWVYLFPAKYYNYAVIPIVILADQNGGEKMKTVIKILLALAVISFALSVIIRLAPESLAAMTQLVKPPVTVGTCLHFTDICLWFAIALGVLQLIERK